MAEGLARSNDAKLIVAYAEEGGLIGRVFAEHGESTPQQLLRKTVDELKRGGIDAELVITRSGKGGEAKAIADLARGASPRSACGVAVERAPSVPGSG